jgi:hypothetical protein
VAEGEAELKPVSMLRLGHRGWRRRRRGKR